jgi:hypothetical protein
MPFAKKAFTSAFVLSAIAMPFAAAADEAFTVASFAQVAIGEPMIDPAAVSAAVVFDNISAYQSATVGANATSTSSTPNTFMGDAYTLTPGTTTITGFDLYPVNLTGTTYTGLKLNIYVWGGVNTGTVSAGAPAFSNLLATYSVTSSGSFTSGFFYSFESLNPGVDPGISLATPLSIPTNTVGITINVQGTTNGVTYANANNLSSVITYGVPATTGSLVFNGYYRNGNSEVNGNFTSAVRSLGFTSQGVALRIYSAVPETGTWLMMGLGLAALALRRRRA